MLLADGERYQYGSRTRISLFASVFLPATHFLQFWLCRPRNAATFRDIPDGNAAESAKRAHDIHFYIECAENDSKQATHFSPRHPFAFISQIIVPPLSDNNTMITRRLCFASRRFH